MDLVAFAVLFMVSIACIIIDYWKKVPYMGVLGGIILILVGIFLSVDSSFTTTVCGIT